MRNKNHGGVQHAKNELMERKDKQELRARIRRRAGWGERPTVTHRAELPSSWETMYTATPPAKTL